MNFNHGFARILTDLVTIENTEDTERRLERLTRFTAEIAETAGGISDEPMFGKSCKVVEPHYARRSAREKAAEHFIVPAPAPTTVMLADCHCPILTRPPWALIVTCLLMVIFSG